MWCHVGRWISKNKNFFNLKPKTNKRVCLDKTYDYVILKHEESRWKKEHLPQNASKFENIWWVTTVNKSIWHKFDLDNNNNNNLNSLWGNRTEICTARSACLHETSTNPKVSATWGTKLHIKHSSIVEEINILGDAMITALMKTFLTR